jgi:hypothetical protein
MGRGMTTECINGHRFATTSNAGSCRNNCGWTWAENDFWDGELWKFDEIYQYEFEKPYYEVPPMCPMSDDEEYDLEWCAPNGIEKHMAYGKEWDWPKGEYKEPVEEIEVK